MDKRICPICRKEFWPTTYNKLYCSAACVRKHKYGHRAIKRCEYCGRFFHAHGAARWCPNSACQADKRYVNLVNTKKGQVKRRQKMQAIEAPKGPARPCRCKEIYGRRQSDCPRWIPFDSPNMHVHPQCVSKWQRKKGDWEIYPDDIYITHDVGV